MKVIKKNRTRRASLLKSLVAYFHGELSSVKEEGRSIYRSLFSTRRRSLGVLSIMALLMAATVAYAASTTQSNTQNINWTIQCRAVDGTGVPICLFFVSEGQNADGSVTYTLKARYTGTATSSPATIDSLFVSTTLTDAPPGATIFLDGAQMTQGVALQSDGPFTLTRNVDMLFTFSVTFGTVGPVFGYYNLSIVVVQ